MSPPLRGPCLNGGGFPRVSGDEPGDFGGYRRTGRFSPRERG